MRYIGVICAVAFMAGCGSEQFEAQKVVQEREDIRVEYESTLLGGWHNSDTHIEFHTSHFNNVIPNQRIRQSTYKTGRYQEGDEAKRFYWALDESGAVTASIIDPMCSLVPLNLCSVVERKRITLSGDEIGSAVWSIESDTDNNGSYEEIVSNEMRRTTLAGKFGEEKLQFLKVSDNFDTPIKIDYSDNIVTLSLPFYTSTERQVYEVSGSVSEAATSISLQAENDVALKQVENFTTSSGEAVTRNVVQSISDFVLRSGINESIIIDYKVSRSIEGLDDTTNADLDLTNFKESEGFTILIEKSVSLLSDVVLDLNTPYYSKIPAGFDATLDGAGNEIIFHEDGTGTIEYVDPSNVGTDITTVFTWANTSTDEIHLLVNGETWALGFVDEVLGGHNVVFYNESAVFGHDFLIAGNIDPYAMVPGRFKLENTDGFSKVDVEFKANGEIAIEAGPVSFEGFWTVADDGSIVSFECDKKDKSVITELAECIDKMQSIGTSESELKFGHIRKFEFLHQNGNQFVSTYNAVAWGEPITQGDSSMHFNWVYRWLRVGE